MANRRVVLSRRAGVQLDSLFDYFAAVASPKTALDFTNGVFDSLENVAAFPHLGAPREDIRTGLRLLTLRRRVTIAFIVDPHAILVVGIFYGGQDFQTILRQDDEA